LVSFSLLVFVFIFCLSGCILPGSFRWVSPFGANGIGISGFAFLALSSARRGLAFSRLLVLPWLSHGNGYTTTLPGFSNTSDRGSTKRSAAVPNSGGSTVLPLRAACRYGVFGVCLMIPRLGVFGLRRFAWAGGLRRTVQ
jgi:hypothetical protein